MEIGLRLSSDQLRAFALYLQELTTWAAKINLVRRRDDREIIIKDFVDSLTVLKYLARNISLADLGSGAGFPGIPAKIVRSDLNVTLVESRTKRIHFLKNVIRVLNLSGIDVEAGRQTRDPGPSPRFFDVVVSRALGPLNDFVSIAGDMIKPGGFLLAMKGRKGEEELAISLPRLENEGWRKLFADDIVLPFLGHERIIIGLARKNVSRET